MVDAWRDDDEYLCAHPGNRDAEAQQSADEARTSCTTGGGILEPRGSALSGSRHLSVTAPQFGSGAWDEDSRFHPWRNSGLFPLTSPCAAAWRPQSASQTHRPSASACSSQAAPGGLVPHGGLESPTPGGLPPNAAAAFEAHVRSCTASAGTADGDGRIPFQETLHRAWEEGVNLFAQPPRPNTSAGVPLLEGLRTPGARRSGSTQTESARRAECLTKDYFARPRWTPSVRPTPATEDKRSLETIARQRRQRVMEDFLANRRRSVSPSGEGARAASSVSAHGGTAVTARQIPNRGTPRGARSVRSSLASTPGGAAAGGRAASAAGGGQRCRLSTPGRPAGSCRASSALGMSQHGPPVMSYR